MREVLPAPDFIGTWCLSSINERGERLNKTRINAVVTDPAGDLGRQPHPAQAARLFIVAGAVLSALSSFKAAPQSRR